MRLTLDNKSKIEVFSSLFQLMKGWSSYINMQFTAEKLYVQLMDKSHICLAELNLFAEWFTTYTVSSNVSLCINPQHFASIINYASKHDSLELLYGDEDIVEIDSTKKKSKSKSKEVSEDHLYVNFLNLKENKDAFNHFFEIPLINADDELVEIPTVDYTVEILIEAKKIVNLFNELLGFGSDLNIIADMDSLQFKATGDNGSLKVDIPAEDLDDYGIVEDEVIDISYSLTHLCKMCASIKLSQHIFIGISDEYPMLLEYKLENDSSIKFYVAPKVSED